MAVGDARREADIIQKEDRAANLARKKPKPTIDLRSEKTQKERPISQPKEKPKTTDLRPEAKTESFDRAKEVGVKQWVKENIKKHPILAAATATLAITAAAATALAATGFTFGAAATVGKGGGTAVITRTGFKHVLTRTAGGGTQLKGAGAITTSRAFTAGKAAVTNIEKSILLKGYASNAATQASTIGLIQKTTGMGTGGAVMMMTLIGTYPFAQFERFPEAADKIGIAMYQAAKEGDHETTIELAQLQQELMDTSTLDKILHLIPFVNIYHAATLNAQKAIKSAEIFQYLAEKELERIENGTTEADKWAQIEIDREEKKEADRIADEEYYAQIAKNDADAKAADRADDEAYWAGILADRQAQDAADRQAEEDYWAEVKITNDKLRAETAPSALNFGLL